jgi:hypothetical protein
MRRHYTVFQIYLSNQLLKVFCLLDGEQHGTVFTEFLYVRRQFGGGMEGFFNF